MLCIWHVSLKIVLVSLILLSIWVSMKLLADLLNIGVVRSM